MGTPHREPYNHFDVGTQSQPISDFVQEDIFKSMSDWVVETTNQNLCQLPTLTQEGSYDVNLTANYNVQGDITSIALVMYVKDGTGNWRIVSGANKDTLLPTNPIPVSGNSQKTLPPTPGGQPLSGHVVLPQVDPTKPETIIQDCKVLVPTLSNTVTAVPPDPTQAQFQIQ